LYINDQYFEFFTSFNVGMARLLAQLIHSTIVFLAMYLVVWHAWRINQHTLKLA
jgi:hypothetical protein